MAIAQLGGNWNNGSNAGLFYWNLNNAHNIASMEAGNGLITYSNSRGLQQKYHVPVIKQLIDDGIKRQPKMMIVSLIDRLRCI